MATSSRARLVLLAAMLSPPLAAALRDSFDVDAALAADAGDRGGGSLLQAGSSARTQPRKKCYKVNEPVEIRRKNGEWVKALVVKVVEMCMKGQGAIAVRYYTPEHPMEATYVSDISVTDEDLRAPDQNGDVFDGRFLSDSVLANKIAKFEGEGEAVMRNMKDDDWIKVKILVLRPYSSDERQVIGQVGEVVVAHWWEKGHHRVAEMDVGDPTILPASLFPDAYDASVLYMEYALPGCLATITLPFRGTTVTQQCALLNVVDSDLHPVSRVPLEWGVQMLNDGTLGGDTPDTSQRQEEETNSRHLVGKGKKKQTPDTSRTSMLWNLLTLDAIFKPGYRVRVKSLKEEGTLVHFEHSHIVGWTIEFERHNVKGWEDRFMPNNMEILGGFEAGHFVAVEGVGRGRLAKFSTEGIRSGRWLVKMDKDKDGRMREVRTSALTLLGNPLARPGFI